MMGLRTTPQSEGTIVDHTCGRNQGDAQDDQVVVMRCWVIDVDLKLPQALGPRQLGGGSALLKGRHGRDLSMQVNKSLGLADEADSQPHLHRGCCCADKGLDRLPHPRRRPPPKVQVDQGACGCSNTPGSKGCQARPLQGIRRMPGRATERTVIIKGDRASGCRGHAGCKPYLDATVAPAGKRTGVCRPARDGRVGDVNVYAGVDDSALV